MNPLAHVDPFGTFILPVLLSLIPGMLPFGYAKPVPINPTYFKNPKKDSVWVGIAGPATNFGLALFLSIVIRLIPASFFLDILSWAITANLILAVFNILPIPPLDGSRILASFLPYKFSYLYLKFQVYGLIFIAILINLGLFRWFITPVIKYMFFIFGISRYYPF